MYPRISLDVCKEAFARWMGHNAGRLGAALAFYALLSLAPLLIFLVMLVGLFFGRHEAREWILQQATQLVGPRGSNAIEGLLHSTHRTYSGLAAGILGVITLLFGASGVFSELRDGLDTIWSAQPKGQAGWKQYARSRLFAFGMILAIGFLLLVSLVFSTALEGFLHYFETWVAIPGPILLIFNFLISLYAIAFLFSLIFRYVSHAHLSWQQVWSGALFTAILFTIGKMLLGFYLGVASVGSAYGAAGSIVAVVVWIYYSAQIFYYGAEFTWVDSAKKKSRAGGAPDISKAAGA